MEFLERRNRHLHQVKAQVFLTRKKAEVEAPSDASAQRAAALWKPVRGQCEIFIPILCGQCARLDRHDLLSHYLGDAESKLRSHAFSIRTRSPMISFELARELKAARFQPSTSPYAVYCLNEDLRIRREQALQMWYGSKTKEGIPLELEREAVFAPSLSELVVACGKPLQLSCDETGRWQACATTIHERVADGETAEEALGRLWLLLEKTTS
jgi:hypothetical protein